MVPMAQVSRCKTERRCPAKKSVGFLSSMQPAGKGLCWKCFVNTKTSQTKEDKNE